MFHIIKCADGGDVATTRVQNMYLGIKEQKESVIEIL